MMGSLLTMFYTRNTFHVYIHAGDAFSGTDCRLLHALQAPAWVVCRQPAQLNHLRSGTSSAWQCTCVCTKQSATVLGRLLHHSFRHRWSSVTMRSTVWKCHISSAAHFAIGHSLLLVIDPPTICNSLPNELRDSSCTDEMFW